MSTFGKRLKEVRELSGKSQTEFGAIGGVLKQAQLKYEKDERMPDAAYLSAIAEKGADVLYILTGQRSAPAALTSDEQMLINHYRACAPSGKAALATTSIELAQPQITKKRA
jgi:transcriptional regulator with XRE-family HTH domain